MARRLPRLAARVAMVFAVQCPEPRCRKYMLVEEQDRGTVVACLICKTPIRVGGQETGNRRQETGDKGQEVADRPNGYH
jgi:hypothetical protein